jgi:hypothetical protein
MSESVVLRTDGLKKSFWRTKKFFLFVCVWYALGPKMGTFTFWAAMQPENYSIGVTHVYGASKTSEGDVTACVDLTNPETLEVQKEVAIRLPVSQYMDGKNPDLVAWTNSVAVSENSSFGVEIATSVERCVQTANEVRTIKSDSWLPRANANAWQQHAVELSSTVDLLAIEVISSEEISTGNLKGRTFGYLSRDINRDITERAYVRSDENGNSIYKNQLRKEHYLEFYFPLTRSGIRWGRSWMLSLVVIDIIFGPLAWLAMFVPLFSQRH